VIIRHFNQCVGTNHEVHAPNGHWISRRLLLKGDGAGFSLHDTVVRAGTQTHMWYANHLEAVYCVAGRGELHDKDSGEIHIIENGMLHVLNEHEHHMLYALEDLRLICVFTPPLYRAGNS
jgi:L-ectoine synthase